MIQCYTRLIKGDDFVKKRFVILLTCTLVFLILLVKLDFSYITSPAPTVGTPSGTTLPTISATPTSTPTSTPTPMPTLTSTPTASEPPKVTVKSKSVLPDGFVYISDALPEAKFEVRYATTHNFTGKVVEGYNSDHISMTVQAAKALQKASKILKEQGYGILIYDAYRPKRAVDFFIEWGEQPETNETKAEFYPDFEKQELFKLGYLAKRSGHSRGSTIDLTIFDLKTDELLDMGSPYDFLGKISNHGTTLISEEQTANRNILKDAMKAAGFKELRTEWWHYQLVNEPFPQTYFDFVIE